MKKNVLFIMTDQHHADHMGCAGHPQAITPGLDRLAAMGTRFTQAYTQNPICLPSRTSFLSGQYCHNHGYYGNQAPTPANLPNYLGHFHDNGYRTARYGKAHLPEDPEIWSKSDCDEFLDREYYEWIEAKGMQSDYNEYPEFGNKLVNEARPSKLEWEDSFEGWAVENTKRFINESGDTPFCIDLSLNRPHHALTPAQQFWDLYPDELDMPETWKQDASHRPPHFQNMVTHTQDELEGLIEPKDNLSWQKRNWKGYLACISHSDHAVVEMLDFLEATGKLENTIIIYGSDHGGYHHNHGIVEKAPGICSDAVCKVPYMWAGPDIPAAVTNDALVENIDLAPTIADLCGLPEMDWVDGESLKPLFDGSATSVKEEAVTENVRSRALRWENWRMVHYPRGMFGEKDYGELYDIIADPNETTNLYESPEHQDIVNDGRRRLLEWLIRTTRYVCSHYNPAIPKENFFAKDGKATRLVSPEIQIKEANENDEVWRLNYV